MQIGREYIIQWVDDPTELRVIFKGEDRGFLIFQSVGGMSIVRARLSSIVVREK
tara:strand:+ start:230 stop:391 length:162 start_codon:yes stop_codon:yes gene_type:complete